MGDMERKVFERENEMRQDPLKLVPLIEEQLDSFDGEGLTYQSKDGEEIWTQEGIGAWEEALEVIKEQKPVSPLAWSNGLALAA